MEGFMGSSFAISLIGFTAFERSTLEAFFRLAARRTPSYCHTAQPEQAQIVLVDVDNADAALDPRALPANSIYIGARGRLGQLGHMPRPINMMGLLRLLDSCVPQHVRAPAPAAAPALAPPAVAAPPAPRVVELTATRTPAPKPQSTPPATALDNILVVDDSDVALRFMANCLGRFGFEVHLARSGEEALNRVADKPFEFVFMDVTMEGIDGYQTCKLIKKRPYPAGRRPPSVIMLTSRGGLVDKMRGTLAGCDAYLTKPLQQDELMKVIGDRIVSDVREADTTALQPADTY
jgi:two-component system, cell cycle response regulator